MKNDDFEKQLQREPMRAIPPEWRAQILSSATRPPEHAARRTPYPARFSMLRKLLWPSPYAWSGLAAMWLVVLLLNLAAADSGNGRVAHLKTVNPVRPSAETLLVLEQHLRLRAELVEPAEFTEPPRPVGTRPRSARHLETLAA